jgi:hypothetical protein
VVVSAVRDGPFGSENGEMCFSGTVPGHDDTDYETYWGAGIGFAVCAYPEDTGGLPSELQAAGEPEQVFSAESCPTGLGATGIQSITFTITGAWPELRLAFRATHDYDVPPFVEVESSGIHTFYPDDAEVPLEWEDEPNAGEVGSSDALEISFQVVSQTDTVSYEFCISDIRINE